LVGYSGAGTTAKWNVSCAPLDGTPAAYIDEEDAISPRLWFAALEDGWAQWPWADGFNCSVALRNEILEKSLGEWALTLCPLGTGSISNAENSLEHTISTVVINTTANPVIIREGEGIDTFGTFVGYLESSSSLTDGIRTRIEYSASRLNSPLVLGLTVCETRLSVINQYIEASSDSPHNEPSLVWDVPAARYLTSDIRTQLGVLVPQDQSSAQRAIMELQKVGPITQLASTDVPEMSSDDTDMTSLALSINLRQGESALMCTKDCFAFSGNSSWPVLRPHRAHLALFQDILTATRSPAQALLAHYSTFIQMAYYDNISEFDKPANATTTFSRLFTMPVRWNGFSAVIAVISVYVLCILYSTLIFLNATKVSLLGNAWQAIAQVALGNPKELVIQSTLRTDDEVL
jgi:hypothetical protein